MAGCSMAYSGCERFGLHAAGRVPHKLVATSPSVLVSDATKTMGKAPRVGEWPLGGRG